MVPPRSDRMSRVPPYSRAQGQTSRTGLSPVVPSFPTRSAVRPQSRWPGPRSLATTDGVSLMSFPRGNEMFQFPRFAFGSNRSKSPRAAPNPCRPKRKTLESHKGPSVARPQNTTKSTRQGGVSPFGNPRIKACSRLPPAYRSVPRPSSPLSAKASTRYPCHT